MKKMLCLILLLAGSQVMFANKSKTGEKQGVKKEAAVYSIEAQSFISTLSYDGDALLKVGIYKQGPNPLKVQVLSGNVSLMKANYQEAFINEGFDLKELPKGSYTIRISMGSEIIERNITKNTEALIFE